MVDTKLSSPDNEVLYTASIPFSQQYLSVLHGHLSRQYLGASDGTQKPVFRDYCLMWVSFCPKEWWADFLLSFPASAVPRLLPSAHISQICMDTAMRGSFVV